MTNDATRHLAADAFLHPLPDTTASGRLAVDPRHTLYWEECGVRHGQPIVFLHGGPGGGSLPHHRRFFDPSQWRIVLFDQRGAGRSTPTASITDNTTWTLVSDLEKLRAHLAIDRFVLFGGSWGSTLALAYAQTYPQRVAGLVLRGIFMATAREIDWFMHGMGRIFPEAWQAFWSYLPHNERDDLLANYHRRLVDPDPSVHLPAAYAWDRYETSCSTLLPRSDMPPHLGDAGTALAIARIEAHYFVNKAFLDEGQLLTNLARIRHIPCTIVHGRYDIVCPIETAYELHSAWPGAQFIVVDDAGHSVREPGIARELVAAVEQMKSRIARD
ncbi:MAG TPA: prolyl aminopeptidase [Casimicrobiaceae bacterium]|nr:prolyl aminopeptidase [Casimicrobiaceae bacterium]